MENPYQAKERKVLDKKPAHLNSLRCYPPLQPIIMCAHFLLEVLHNLGDPTLIYALQIVKVPGLAVPELGLLGNAFLTRFIRGHRAGTLGLTCSCQSWVCTLRFLLLWWNEGGWHGRGDKG